MSGTLVPTERSKKEGKLTLTLELPFVGTNSGPEYVLGTDYEKWAVVYSCRGVQVHKYGYSTMGAWILTRKQKLSDYTSGELVAMNKDIDSTLTAAGLQRNKFITTDQNC